MTDARFPIRPQPTPRTGRPRLKHTARAANIALVNAIGDDYQAAAAAALAAVLQRQSRFPHPTESPSDVIEPEEPEGASEGDATP